MKIPSKHGFKLAKKKNKTSKPGKQQPARTETVKPQQKKSFSAKPILPGSWKMNGLFFLVFLIVTVILYSPDLHLGFFRIDDQQYVVRNPWIRGISGQNINYILSHHYFANYSPMHLFSYMIDYAIGGPGAYGFHLSSNIWAGLVAGFVFLIALALTKKRIIATAAAVLFIVHPVHVEAVAWISSRKDLVAAAFILPSFLAYLYYRRGENTKRWYFLSLFLFLLAVAGKLSVATFPAVLFAYDLFVEKRSFVRSLLDKIPFLLIAIIISVAVANAQPKTGLHFDLGVLAKALGQSIWVMTGFASYVIYRVPPQPGGVLTSIIGLVALLAVFLAPLLLRKKFPLVVVLIYWILFTYLPTQILSFAYPVTDRYLFLPSVAACILICIGLYAIIKGMEKWRWAIAALAFAIVLFFWTKNTVAYLNEWRDPRSVWYAAKEKSSDVQVYYNLGWNYMDKAAALGTKRRKAPLPTGEAKQLANVVWENNPQLPALLNELDAGKHDGAVENAFQKYLQDLSLNAMDEALAKKGAHVMADLFFHRGMLKLDKGDAEGAKQEFIGGLNEASKLQFAEGQQEVMVNCHYNLAIAEWTLKNYEEALRWIRIAEDEQNRFGGNWFPELTDNRKKLEQIVASLQH